jgi:cellulose synthase/poly-beta-1,6-N-acetylglucosamine synthase-like glycosyltransferase
MELGHRQFAALSRLEEIVREHVSRRIKSKRDEPLRLCPELDCIRDRIDPDTIEAMARRALAVGVGAERALITSGIIDEENYARAFARSLALPFEPLDGRISRAQCPLTDKELLAAPAAGILPLLIDGELTLVIAPRGMTARRMARARGADPRLPARARITTTARLTDFVTRTARDAVGAHAADALRTEMPELSAGPARRWRTLIPAFIIAPFVIGAFIAAPGPVMLGCELVLAFLFLGWIILRIVGTLIHAPDSARDHRLLPDAALPTYTILIALYREAAAIGGLVSALKRLDYPAEKLDIKLIVEPDDTATQEALARLDLGPPFEVFVAPAAGPRTKPKALNAALPFARGTFTVIFDAEDRPEPDQLRRALDVFEREGDALACVQGTLAIDNVQDNWITAMFAAEYAGLFDVFLPALSALGMPLPLGGSSNHFRTGTLRAVGAWDPYNVTEDADLGLRLARFGYRSVAMESTTYEEAPARIGAWLKQRTRWFKGWMQTWLVHMRRPLALRRQIGTGAFVTVQLMVGGNVLAALIHPVLLISLAYELAAERPLWDTPGESAVFAVVIIAGYFASALLCLVGLVRRRLTAHAWVLVLMPVHWLLLALAAWRALFQLARDPYRWEKTEHVLTRRVRRPAAEIVAEILASAATGASPAQDGRRGRNHTGRAADGRYGTRIEKLTSFVNL